MYRRIIFVLSILLILHLAKAQSDGKGIITGILVDSISQKPLYLTTITVFKASDTTLLTYRLSTENGMFKVTGLPINVGLRMIVSFSGYAVIKKDFSLSSDNTSRSFDTIFMSPNTEHTLAEVLVFAEQPPVIIRKDTIEFNASSFKTLPNSFVEDLLKKLPGVQIDREGNITVNGRRVNKIMVDGKDFFGGNPQMATRNLPANIIEKVQVVNDYDEQELNPDKLKADIGQVINLKLKKSVKKGLFGRAHAGKATSGGYEIGSILNVFRDTMQISLIGFTNNLNKASFRYNDIMTMGGFGRSGTYSVSNNSTGGFNINGISFGGTGEGVQTSSGVGFNLNHDFRKGIKFSTQYFYGKTQNDIVELENVEQFLNDTILTSRTNRNEISISNIHRLDVGSRWAINPSSRLEIGMSLSVRDINNSGMMTVETKSNVKGDLNLSNNQKKQDVSDIVYRYSMLYFKKFRKEGRTFNLSNSLSFSKRENNQFNDVRNIFSSNVNNSIDQLRDINNNQVTTNTTLNFSEPLFKDISLRVTYNLNTLLNEDALTTLDKNLNTGRYDLTNTILTNRLKRVAWQNNFSTGLNIKAKKLSITATTGLLVFNAENKFLTSGNKLDQQFQYFLPSINVNWNTLSIGYSTFVTAPNIVDIQPVPDNTNPLYVHKGNPALKPSFSNRLFLFFSKNNPQKQIFFNFNLNGSFISNAIVRNRSINQDGVQVTEPFNTNGVHEFYNNIYLSKQVRVKSSLLFNIIVGNNLVYQRNFLVVNYKKSFVKRFEISPFLRSGINWNDKIEWNMGVNPGLNNSFYENKQFKNLSVIRTTINTDFVIRAPKKLVWEITLDHRINAETADGVQQSITLLNAGLNYLFLKEDKGQLKFSVFDLLNQNRSVFRFSAENYITDRQVNILQRYFMLTFTYNIRSFGAAGKGAGGKVGGRQSLFFF